MIEIKYSKEDPFKCLEKISNHCYWVTIPLVVNTNKWLRMEGIEELIWLWDGEGTKLCINR
jgi:hypothetical protein